MCFHGRQDAIRYLTLNASTLLEDFWAEDDSLWLRVPMRQIDFEGMLAERQTDLGRSETTRPVFEEKDFACNAEDEIRGFAFDVRALLLTGRARHLAICPCCQRRLEYWTGLVETFDQAMPLPNGNWRMHEHGVFIPAPLHDAERTTRSFAVDE